MMFVGVVIGRWIGRPKEAQRGGKPFKLYRAGVAWWEEDETFLALWWWTGSSFSSRKIFQPFVDVIKAIRVKVTLGTTCIIDGANNCQVLKKISFDTALVQKLHLWSLTAIRALFKSISRRNRLWSRTDCRIEKPQPPWFCYTETLCSVSSYFKISSHETWRPSERLPDRQCYAMESIMFSPLEWLY